jgi:hypothetical protein
MLGMATKDVGTATLVSSALIFCMLLWSGFLINPTTIPPALSWAKYGSLFHWGCNALYYNECGGTQFVMTMFGMQQQVDGSYLLESTFNLTREPLNHVFAALVTMTILYQAAATILAICLNKSSR